MFDNLEYLERVFKENGDEYLEFIKVEDKLSYKPDLHAFLLIDELFSDKRSVISGANHEEIYLNIDFDEAGNLPEDILIELIRCGVILDFDTDSLKMLV